MIQVNIHEAKTQLSKLLERVEQGEEVVIARAGVPIARLVATAHAGEKRVLGRDRGLFTVPDDFDEPLPDEVLAGFNG